MNWRWLVSIAVFLASFVFAWKVRQYPWQLGLVVGLAVGALVYSVTRTLENLLPFWLDDVQLAKRNTAPGEDPESEKEKKVGRQG